jgi:hypothetical protein
MSVASVPNPPARQRLWRRWLLRAAVIFFAFLFTCFVIVEIILLTGLPRDLVVAQVEKGFGLRMQVKSLSTGWFGNTTLDGVKLSLPLSDTAFVDVPEMRISHTNLLAMALGFDIRIQAVELDKPVVRVSQNAAGQWNLLDVAELLARTAGKRTGQATESQTPSLPELHINAASVRVTDNQQHSLTIEPINVTGDPESAVTYAYDIEIPSNQKDQPAHVSFRGRVAPGGTWGHDAHLWIHDIDPWLAALRPGLKIPLAFDGSWTGQFTNNGVTGFAKISDASAFGYHLDGIVRAAQTANGISISPDNLRLRTGIALAPEIKLPKGELAYDGKVIRMTRMQMALLGGPVEANGWFEPDTQQGALEAVWQGLKLDAPQIAQSGKLNVAFSRPPAADMTLDVLLSSSGTAPEGNFEAVAKLDVSGRTFSNLNWSIEAPQLAWYRPQSIILDGIKANGAFRDDPQHSILSLSAISLPRDNRLTGVGSYDFSTKSGEINLSGQDWPVHLLEGTRLAFGLEARGTGVPSKTEPNKTVPIIDLSQFYLRSGDAGITITGKYDGQKPKPVSAQVVFENNPSTTPGTGVAVLIRGLVRGDATLLGTLDPLHINMTGTLDGDDAVILNHQIGDIHTAVRGSLDFQKAAIQADAIPFLDGLWTLGATYVLHEDKKPVYATTIDIGVEHLPLPKVSEFLGIPTVQGMFDGRWYVYYPRLKPDPDKVVVTGAGSIQNASYQQLVADNITFQTRMQHGIASVKPIVVQTQDGRIDALASLSLSQSRRIHSEIKFTSFPVALGNGADIRINGGSKQIDMLLPDNSATDPAERQFRVNAPAVDLKVAIDMNKKQQGQLELTAAMDGRIAELKKLEGEILGGKIAATAATDIDHLDQANANITWDGIQSSRIIALYPQLQGLAGAFSVKARMQPAVVARPLQPLQVDAYLYCDKARWRDITLGDGQLHAFADPYSNQFIASNAQATSMQVAGGSADFWYSASRHLDTIFDADGNEIPSGVTLSNLLNLTLKDINLDPFVTSFSPKHGLGLGKLSGRIYTLSAPQTKLLADMASQATTMPTTAAASQSLMQHILATTTVNGDLTIDHSNLAAYGPITVLYNLMHLGANSRTPTGTGSVNLAMEQGTLHVKQLHFFNKGIEVLAVADIDRTWELPDCPIHGSAAGSLQLLRNIKIPVLAEANSVLQQLQGQLTGVEFAGTLLEPTKNHIHQISLSQFGDQLKGLFLSQIGSQR